MHKETIFQRECEMQGSPYTLLIYKEEFDESLTSVLEKLRLQIKNKEDIDIEEWLRIAWAMCKTYDGNVSNYERWLEEFDADIFDLGEGWDAFVVILSAADAELFRAKETKRERFKRKLIEFIKKHF